MTTDLPARMLRLLSLLQTRREWSGVELAERLGVTTRTIRRDIDRLRELEYPVEGTTGHAGGYRLAAGAAMPPLILDDEEATVTAVALRTAAGQLAGMEETTLRALAKLEQVLPTRLRSQVAALQQATSSIDWEDRGPRTDAATLAALAAACRDLETVTFDYTTRTGTAAARRVDPQQLVASGGLWYLLAHDHARDDWRIYRLDRITALAPTRQRFTPRTVPGGDPAQYVASKIAGAPVRYRAIATVHEPAGALRSGELAHAAGFRRGTVVDADVVCDQLLLLRAPLAVQNVQQLLAVDLEDVEGDEVRRYLCSEAGCGAAAGDRAPLERLERHLDCAEAPKGSPS